MKKAIVLLLALVLIGGFAFAEDAAAPAAPAPIVVAGPTATFGLDANAGYNVIKDKSVVVLDDTLLIPSAKSVMQVGAATYKFEPWAQLAWGGFTLKATQGVKYNETTVGGLASTSQIKASYAFGGLTITDNFVWDRNDYTDRAGGWLAALPFNNEMGLKVVQDNVTAELVYRNTTAPAAGNTAFGYFGNMLSGAGYSLRQAYFTVKDVFGFDTVKVGDRLNKNYLRMTSIADNVFTSQSVNGRYSPGDLASYMSVFNTADISKLVKDLGLTVYTGANIPLASMLLPDYLRAGKTLIGAKYALKDVGTFDAGIAPSMDYTTNAWAATYSANLVAKSVFIPLKGISAGLAEAMANEVAASYEAGYSAADFLTSTSAATAFWADANISLVKDLSLQIGIDGNLGGQYVNRKTFATGVPVLAGTAVTLPVTKLEGVSYNIFNIGLEASYDLTAAVKGLSVTGSVYTALGSGADFETLRGVTWANYIATLPDAGNFKAASYTEANYLNAYLYDYSPFQFNVGAAYALNDTFSFSLKNAYNSFANTYNKDWDDNPVVPGTIAAKWAAFQAATGAKAAYGYYGTDAISLGCDVVAGKGTLSFGAGYTIFTGLPTAADLYVTGMTDAAKKNLDATYAAFLSSNFNPWSFSLTYKAAF